MASHDDHQSDGCARRFSETFQLEPMVIRDRRSKEVLRVHSVDAKPAKTDPTRGKRHDLRTPGSDNDVFR